MGFQFDMQVYVDNLEMWRKQMEKEKKMAEEGGGGGGGEGAGMVMGVEPQRH